MNPNINNMLTFQLDLKNFDPAHHQHFVDRARELHYQFFFLSEAADSSENRKMLYDLVREGVLTSPQNDGTFETYDEFMTNLYHLYYRDVGDSHVIAEIDGEWVGLTSIAVDTQTGVGKCGLTAVRKSRQNQGLAKALKVISLTRAKGQGAKVVLTNNHSANHAMIRVNRTFGFEQGTGN
ncbi:MAG: GNAT family N-acetyltransferase [Chloroflexota bacterium]